MSCPSLSTNSYKNLGKLLESLDWSDSSKTLGSVVCFVEGLVRLVLDLAGLLAIIMILYSAFIYVTSYGEESKLESAKKTLLWSIIGIVVIGIAKLVFLMIDHELGKTGA